MVIYTHQMAAPCNTLVPKVPNGIWGLQGKNEPRQWKANSQAGYMGSGFSRSLGEQELLGLLAGRDARFRHKGCGETTGLRLDSAKPQDWDVIDRKGTLLEERWWTKREMFVQYLHCIQSSIFHMLSKNMEHRLRNPESWAYSTGLPLTSMILGKLLNLSVPWFFIRFLPNKWLYNFQMLSVNHWIALLGGNLFFRPQTQLQDFVEENLHFPSGSHLHCPILVNLITINSLIKWSF